MSNLEDLADKYSGQVKDKRDLILLLAAASKKNKEFIYTHPKHRLSWLDHWRFKYYLYLYKKNYPLAYIFQHKEFYGLDFYINKHVLVPRPETEHLVDEAITAINQPINKHSLLIDIGTGSGCIPIAILKKNNLPAIAIDISAQALQVAKKNARRHKTDIQFIKGDLLQPLLTNQTILKDRNSLIITANLPYLTQAQYESEPSLRQEPRQALVANELGLELYARLLKQIRQLAAGNTVPFYIFLEIDPQQTEGIIKLINQYLPLTKITIKPDLAGRNRVVCLNFLPLLPPR